MFCPTPLLTSKEMSTILTFDLFYLIHVLNCFNSNAYWLNIYLLVAAFLHKITVNNNGTHLCDVL